jgi:hypothetical protein
MLLRNHHDLVNHLYLDSLLHLELVKRYGEHTLYIYV